MGKNLKNVRISPVLAYKDAKKGYTQRRGGNSSHIKREKKILINMSIKKKKERENMNKKTFGCD